MQVKPYSSYYDTQISNLLNQLVIKADEASRCQEILDRLNGLDRDTKVPVDVVDFIGNYAPIEIVSNEGLISKGIDVIKKALDGLMKAIIWIIQKLKEIFKYCFDAEYRACKDTLDLQRRIIVISANLTACTKFGGLNCDVISKKDIDDIIVKTQQLTELIANAAKMSDQTYIEILMNTFGTQAGISKDGNNVLTDNIPNPVPLRSVTYGSAGWDISGITSTITNYLSMLRGIEGLKEVNRNVEAAAKDFKRRAEQAALNGATAGDVVALQKEAATKIAMTTIMGYAIAISSRRSENILEFLNSIYTELRSCTK